MPPQYLLFFCYFTLVFARRGGGGYLSRRSGSHSYPSSHGLSGKSNTYSSYHRLSNTHAYPQSTRFSGNTHSSKKYRQKNEVHNHYHQNTRFSGNTHSSTSYRQRSKVQNHYHYSPPQHISYSSKQYPVFVGTPPSYVYVYKNSGSRYDNLLTGLALYNLGRMSNSHGYHDHYYERGNSQEYRGNPGEICKLGISKTNGEYEETRIDCELMSSFIWEAERENKQTPTVTKTVTAGPTKRPRVSSKCVCSELMHGPFDLQCSISHCERAFNVTQTVNNGNTTVTIQNTTPTETKTVDVTQTVNKGNTTVTSQNTTVEAVEVKGSSIQVNPGMKCFMIRIARDSSILKKSVECGLLHEYASRSLHDDGYAGRCTRAVPVITILVSFVIILL